MKVVPLDPDLEPLFWEHLYTDIPLYYFFILDMKHDRASTTIMIALKNQYIEGMMLTYQERIVQLRGSYEAVKTLLTHLDIGKVEIQGYPEHQPLISEKFKKVNKTMDIFTMTLRKGEEALQIDHSVERLSPEDAGDIAELLRQAGPDWWGDTTAQTIADRMHERLWVGIKVGCHLVSVGGAVLDEWGSNIATIATHHNHRNKGYATSVVSTLVNQIFQISNLALIHVECDNKQAFRAYTKVGFTPYRRYVVVRAEKE